jgi:hypothetical protein
MPSVALIRDMSNKTDVKGLIGFYCRSGRHDPNALPTHPQDGAAILERTLFNLRIPQISCCDEVRRRWIDKIVDRLYDWSSFLGMILMNEDMLHSFGRLGGVKNTIHTQWLCERAAYSD